MDTGRGVRVRTLVGLIRVDIGYNPYQRAAGSAYFDTAVSAGGQLFCVSPTNTLRVTAVGGGVVGPVLLQQETGACPASFTPTRERSFFRRLVPQISLGQAF